jgi:hypothetical protein
MDSGKLLLLGACLVVIAPLAASCSCMQVSVDDAINDSSYIFTGTVTDLERLSSGDHEATVDVTEVWKGPNHSEVAVRTPESSAACGFPFQEGTSYLVYTNTEDRFVSLCSRTAELSNAEADLEALGEGETPTGPPAEGFEEPGMSNETYWLLAGVVMVLGVLVYYRRSIRERLDELRE